MEAHALIFLKSEAPRLREAICILTRQTEPSFLQIGEAMQGFATSADGHGRVHSDWFDTWNEQRAICAVARDSKAIN